MNFDMDTTMRINNLARELLKSGAAASLADAHAKAETIIVGEMRIKPTAQQAGSSAGAQNMQAAAVAEMPPNEYEKLAHSDDRILRDLSMIKAKLDELQRSVSGLSKDLEAIKLNMPRPSQFFERKAEPTLAQETQQAQQSEQKPAPALQPRGFPPKEERREQKTESNPIRGSYTSDDVSMEKFFYSGSKK